MANLEPALALLWHLEGGYRAKPETLFGVDRNANPDWPGWKLVDEKRSLPGFPQLVEMDDRLRNLAAILYRNRYWKPIRGGDIRSQKLADQLFAIGVHSGPGTAVKYLQRALNTLSRAGSLFAVLAEDGVLGAKTLDAIDRLYQVDGAVTEARLLLLIESQQVGLYMQLARGAAHADDVRGYLRRILVGRGEAV